MGQGQRSNQILVRGAERALDQFKLEVAREIGLQTPTDGYWGDYSTRQCGAMGGHMVRRMIQDAESRLAGGSGLSFGGAIGTHNVGAAGFSAAGGYGGAGTTAGHYEQ